MSANPSAPGAIAMLAELEQREAEDELLVTYGFEDQVAPEDRARTGLAG